MDLRIPERLETKLLFLIFYLFAEGDQGILIHFHFQSKHLLMKMLLKIHSSLFKSSYIIVYLLYFLGKVYKWLLKQLFKILNILNLHLLIVPLNEFPIKFISHHLPRAMMQNLIHPIHLAIMGPTKLWQTIHLSLTLLHFIIVPSSQAASLQCFILSIFIVEQCTGFDNFLNFFQ